MAIIETNEGDRLVVNKQSTDPSLFVEARLNCDGRSRTIDERLFSIYTLSADKHGDCRPRSRGELTADRMQILADKLIGWAVVEGYADRRRDVTIENLKVVERDDAARAGRPYLPTYEDDYPEDASDSEQIRWLLENHPTSSADDIAAGLGCSRSLISDVKRRMEQ